MYGCSLVGSIGSHLGMGKFKVRTMHGRLAVEGFVRTAPHICFHRINYFLN